MTKPKLYPFINRFSGEIQVMTKKQGKELNEDWDRAKVTKNQQGEKVFRFKLSAPVKDRNGKTIMGTAIIDLTENNEPVELEGINGNGNTK